jgi:hypothetical protein
MICLITIIIINKESSVNRFICGFFIIGKAPAYSAFHPLAATCMPALLPQVHCPS